jgi:hypothetical protein
VRQPLLLLCSPDNLRMRCQQLQQLLSAVPADKLSKQLRRTPELLLMRPITLAAKLKCLELLLVPPTAGGQMAAAGPSAAAGETVLNAAAGSIAGPDKDQQPEMQGSPQQPTPSAADQQQQRLLHAYHQQELSYRLQRLQAAAQARLHTSTNAASSSSSSSSSATAPRVQHLALKVPGLLSLQPATLQSHVLELQLLLGLQADDPRLTRMVLLQPGLLTQSPKTLAHKLQLLQDLTGRPEAYAHGMVLRCPAVLTLSADSVTAKWGLLQRCVAACGTWQQELTAAPAVSVAMMLCYSIRRLQRLQYVLQLSQQQQREELQRASCTPDDAQPNPVEEDGMLSSSGSSRRRQRRSRQAAAAAPGCGKPPASQQHQQQQQQQHQSSVQQLPELPWKSLIQEADSTFCRRFPGFRAWLQQQPAEQQQQPADQQQLPPARPGARAAVAARQLAAVA